MELIERKEYMVELFDRFKKVETGSGHTLFLTGEAGIGKTSLLDCFLKDVENLCTVHTGACDSLFTPRPLGPLYDIATQSDDDFLKLLRNEKNRALLFATFLKKISACALPVVLIFEDIHWADEATIDLIKFLARRIERLKCLFLLTYRDDEIHPLHPLTNLFGELPRGSFSKIKINPLSFEAVTQLAKIKGNAVGEKLYSLTNGNPFYVTEILASDSPGIPERVKDSILAVFYKKDKKMKELWELLSILPLRIEHNLIRHLENEFSNFIDECIHLGVIISKQDYLCFKHELYRVTIEESLSAVKQQQLHGKILKIMLENPSEFDNLSQLVHHAQYANEKKIVVEFAPKVAQLAASVGSHLEASKLYYAAIQYSGQTKPELVELYEKHAYECYLTYQIPRAIASQQRVLDIWRERKVKLKEGDALRFLSRLWWFEGNYEKSRSLALESIEVLENGFPTRERALAYSNLSQLNMLADSSEQSILWGNKAINLATRMDDIEVLAHALNNIGTIMMKCPITEKEGEENLNRSLSLALENGFDEHAARAYTNIASSFVAIRKYKKAEEVFEQGLRYCELRDLNPWTYYMLSWKSRMLLETGRWKKAEELAEKLQRSASYPGAGIVRVGALISLAKLKIRTGDFDAARPLIDEARQLVMSSREPQRIVPVLAIELELHWLTGSSFSFEGIEFAINDLFPDKNQCWLYSELTYWLNKNSLLKYVDTQTQYIGPHHFEMNKNWLQAAEAWKNSGCPYEEALALMHGDVEQKKKALILLDELGATAAYEAVRTKFKLTGAKNMPRGQRESTRSNPANLTQRQVDVLHLLVEGLQNSEIADKLFISNKTVDHHISAILSKLEVNSRSKAVFEAKKLGILK